METGNNLRLPKDDFIFILEDVAEEIAEEPGFEGFQVTIDKKGANILTGYKFVLPFRIHGFAGF